MIRHFLSWQFIGFLAVGGTAALLHWLARILLSQWLPFGIAVAGAYGVGMATAFTLNSLFVFSNSNRARRLQVRDFTLINLAFFPLVWLTSIQLDKLLIGLIRHHQAMAHAIAIVMPMLATFLFYKFFVFREHRT